MMKTRVGLEEMVRQDGPLTERLEKCCEMIGAMCRTGRPPKMSVPVQWNDEDFYIVTTINDAIALSSAITAGAVAGVNERIR